MRFGDGCVAQLVEQLTLNQRVQGSNPCTPTNQVKAVLRQGLLAACQQALSLTDIVAFAPVAPRLITLNPYGLGFKSQPSPTV